MPGNLIRPAGPDLTFPPDLERYLSPSLWRRLSADAPRRGVLLSALGRLRSILYLLSTHLPRHLVQEKMRRPVRGLVRGQTLSGTLLFADVSGFTALSERLAVLGQEGAEQLTKLMNDYFEEMLQILIKSGGILLKFAGDALLAYFPEQGAGEQARWAVRAGHRMLAAIADFAAIETPLGMVGLRMKIGVGTGQHLAASVGNAQRMEYVVFGDAVARTMGAEGAAEAGLIVVDEATAVFLDPACCRQRAPGFYAVERLPDRDLDDFEIKAETRRARGAIPWSASPRAIVVQMEVALRQIEALTPYLAPELVAHVVAHARQRALVSEFRSSTVMFLNFTGLELLLAAWGSTGVRRVTRLLDDYFQAMHRVIARHGGAVSRIDPYSQGSKMLVLFGALAAHEEQPHRAVSTALAMNDELAALNERWQRQLARYLPLEADGPLLQHRIGITRGPTFAGQVGSATRREYTVMGDDVNLAARLMAAAEPGHILVNQQVYDAVEGLFSATALSPIRVKGKSQPIPIYQPAGPRDDPLARRLHSWGPLVARDAEVEQGQAIIDRAVAGQGATLNIRGAAGLGKSHLGDTLAAYALARKMRVLFGACRSFTAEAAYAPWITLLETSMGIVAADPPGARWDKLLHALADLGLDVKEHVVPLAGLMGLQEALLAAVSSRPARRQAAGGQPDPRPKPALFARLQQRVADEEERDVNLWKLVRERPHDRQQGPSGQIWQNLQSRVSARQQERLLAAVCEWLSRLSADVPLLIYFESAQWMDPASRALVDYLGARLRELPIVVLVVGRGEREGSAVAGAGVTAAAGRQATLTLEPLSFDATCALVALLLDEALPSADLLSAIHRQSGGNPLFVEEIVQGLQREGDAVQGAVASDLQFSGTLQDLVLSRLDNLPHSQRDTARAASIVGSEFRRRTVQVLLPSTTDDAVLDGDLAGLEQARFTLLTDAADARYAFRQTLVREVLYNSQPFARRRAQHGQLAAYLEEQHREDVKQHAELLAHHYELAEQFLPAARYLLVAGDKARQRYVYPQAKGYYREALAALDQMGPRELDDEASALRMQALEGQGDVALLTGDFAAATESYEAALASLGDEAPAELLLKLALVLPTQPALSVSWKDLAEGDRTAEAEAYARRAWALQENAGRLAAAATCAWLLWRAGSIEAGDWIGRARELASQGADGLKVADDWSAGIAALLSDFAGEWTLAQRAYLAIDRPIGAALAACRAGDRLLEQGDVAAAQAFYGQAAQIWEQENDGCGLALARYCQAEASIRDGDAAAARSALLEAQRLLETAESATQDDREALEQALAAIDAGEPGTWPPWRWRRYDDAFRISMLYRLLCPTVMLMESSY